MKAAWYEKNGAARDVLVFGEMPTPDPGPGEVLVRLNTSGVNPSDVKGRAGRPLVAPRAIPHSDGAGVVEAVGEGVERSRIGERVWIWNGQWKRPFGTAAEYIALPEAQAVRLPAAVDDEAAACLGIPAMTAIHAVTLSVAGPGRTLLVIGGATAVGHYATQMAVARGARVIATASGERADAARQAGAETVIDYRSEDVAERVKELTERVGVDAIIDMDFSSTAPLLARGVLRSHGIHVVYGSNVASEIPVSFPALLWGNLTLRAMLVYDLLPNQRRRAQADLEAMLSAGALQHRIGATYKLDEIVAAHEAVEAGKVQGNVVLRID